MRFPRRSGVLLHPTSLPGSCETLERPWRHPAAEEQP
jgi:hypothetical protein